MHKIEVPQKQITLGFPEQIEEMTTRQYIEFARLNCLFSMGKISYTDLRIQMVYKLLDMDRKMDISRKKSDSRAVESISALAGLVDGFYRQEKNGKKVTKHLINENIENPLAEFTHNDVKYIGPTTGLFDSCFGQFVAGNTAMVEFSKTKDIRQLDALVAALYLPYGQVYHPKSPKCTAKDFKGLDLGIKYGVFLYYTACQSWLASQDRLELGGDRYIDLTVLFKPGESSGPSRSKIGLLGHLITVAELGPFGDIDAVAARNTIDILTYLADKHIGFEKLKSNGKGRTA